MNICSNIGYDVGGRGCGKQVKRLQHMNIMKVPHVDALARVPVGAIGIVTADIETFGIRAAISMAAQKQDIDIRLVDDRPRAPELRELKVIDHMHTFTIEPKVKKIKSSKGKTNYGSNYTPPKKKRKR